MNTKMKLFYGITLWFQIKTKFCLEINRTIKNLYVSATTTEKNCLNFWINFASFSSRKLKMQHKKICFSSRILFYFFILHIFLLLLLGCFIGFYGWLCFLKVFIVFMLFWNVLTSIFEKGYYRLFRIIAFRIGFLTA